MQHIDSCTCSAIAKTKNSLEQVEVWKQVFGGNPGANIVIDCVQTSITIISN